MANNPSQIDEVLADPFSVTPCLMDVESKPDGTVHMFHSFLGQSSGMSRANGGTRIMGSIVTNPQLKNSSALVLPVSGAYQGAKNSSARLLIKAVSPRGPQLKKTIDFFPILDVSQSDDDGSTPSNLRMRITDGLSAPSADTANVPGQNFDLCVAPGSAVLVKVHRPDQDRLEELGIDWGNLIDIAKKVVPVVAKSGYDIYNQLKNQPTGKHEDSVDSFWSDVGSVVQVAAPIAGTLLM